MRYVTESFVKKAEEKHGNRFDYSKTEYAGYDVPTTFICRKHGEFKQTPHAHLYHDVCCPECVREINESQRKPKPEKIGKDKTLEFIEKSKAIWGDLYGYGETKYISSLKKVVITCPVHGDVEVYPSSHLDSKKYSGCPKCNMEKRYEKGVKVKGVKETPEERKERLKNDFIRKARTVHGDKYDYSKVDYKSNKVPVTIICPVHGEFMQRPNDHISHGDGCPMCGKRGRRNKPYTQEEYIKLANEVFGGYYTYPRTIYKAMQKPIIVTCPEHGDFEIRAFDHLYHKCGCPEHHAKSSLELQVEKMLIENNVKYVYQKRFPWLGLQSLDFYLPDYNIGIECQGEQHFESVEPWGGKKNLESNKKRDELKKELCEEHGVGLLYYTEKRFMKYLTESKEVSFFEIEKIYEKIFSKCLL